MPGSLRVAAPLTGAALALAIVGSLGGARLVWGDGDPAMHVALGRAIASRGAIPAVDPFLQGAPAFRDHEWLFDVLAAGAWRIGQGGALAAAIALIFAAVGAELARQVCAQARPLAATPALLWALAVSPMHLQARPHILTWAFLVFGRGLVDRKPPFLVWVAFGALWANLHGGFLPGIALLGFLGGPRTALGLALGSLVNPAGPWLHVDILRFLFDREVLSRTEDFQPALPGARGFPAFVMVAGEIALAVALARPGRRDLMWAAILVAFAASTVRNVPMVALLAAPDVGRWLQARLDRWRTPDAVEAVARIEDRIRRLAPAAAPLAVLAGLICLFRLPAPPEAGDVPLAALAALPPAGVVFATVHWGGWVALVRPELALVTHPLTADYADAGARIHEYAIVSSAAEGWDDALDRRGVTAVWIAPAAPLGDALRSAGWVVAYEDANSVALLRPAGG